jgi:hypothetical protein
MAHCGYEPTAVNDTLAHPLKALLTWWRGPRTEGPLAPELPMLYAELRSPEVDVTVDQLQRRGAS